MDQFVERIARAKELMFSNHIELDNYCEIKSDYEKKISVLGDVITGCSQNQLQLTQAKEVVSKHGLQLETPFDRLTDENRCSFLHHILIRPTKWESVAVGECVFKEVFYILCGQNIIEEELMPDRRIQCEKLLYQLACLEFSVEALSNI